MKRKTSSNPTKTYSYGALAPIEGAELVHAQLDAAHKYHGDLVAIERARRTERTEFLSSIVPELSGADSEVERLFAVPQSERGSDWKDKVQRARKLRDTLFERASSTLRSRLKRDQDRVAEARKSEPASTHKARARDLRIRDEMRSDPTTSPEWIAIQNINDMARSAADVAYSQSDLYHGTRALVMRDHEAACKKLRMHWPSRDSQRIGFQIIGGITPEEALSGEDTRLRIADPECYGKDRRSRTTVAIRVGSNGREPVWAVFPVLMHRPFPDDCRIMWAWILRRRVGPGRTVWKLQLSVEAESFSKRNPSTDKSVAVDLCWRSTNRGLRVAYDSSTGELVLPTRWRRDMEHVRSLLSIADKRFDQAKRLVRKLRRQGKLDSEATRYAHQWRAPKKLDRIVREMKIDIPWRDWITSGKPPVGAWARERGLDPVLAFLECWRRQDRHLRQWAEDRRGRLLRERRDIYRVYSARLARTYSELVLEDMAIPVELKPEAGELVEVAERRNSQRHDAALSELRSCLLQAFGGIARWLVPAEDSAVCQDCGNVYSELGPACFWTCDCGRKWDRNDAGSRNLLSRAARGEGIVGPRPPLAKSKVKPKRARTKTNLSVQEFVKGTSNQAAE